ncbi:protein of unknown function [Ectothiorhodospira magna]|uniref:DUF4390 domain-containing protein n=1 Tax=Ectothiorhodospira magna TaxID=867345 RepID=A0A1H9FJ09_9GAMM|nr:DUF4390 domain-containing protein [Ectothiorhodospira magna]SEQ37877.1 protein of unknown function [Ectothiorhodospira magna]
MPRRPPSSSLILLLAWLLIWPPTTVAGEDHPLRVRWAGTELVGGVYLLNADIDYQLTRKLDEALHNGVRLTFEVQIQITRGRDWLWDASVAELIQRYRVEHHALSRLYIVTHLNTGVQRAFYRLESALYNLGHLRDLPLLDAPLLDPTQDYGIRLRTRLRAQDLPLPLRARAYVSREWSPVSEWYSWSLR